MKRRELLRVATKKDLEKAEKTYQAQKKICEINVDDPDVGECYHQLNEVINQLQMARAAHAAAESAVKKTQRLTELQKMDVDGQDQAAEDKVRTEALSAEKRATAGLAKSPRQQPPKKAGGQTGDAVLSSGTKISWGLTSSLLRFQTTRSSNLSRANPVFRPRLRALPGDVGFQFLSEPATYPWRLHLGNGGDLQLISFGGMLLTEVGNERPFEQGSLSLVGTLAFFNNTIGAGLGFDMYRGIPILGSNGEAGSDTAFTGPLAWAFSQEGEVTAENAFIVVFANVSAVVEALTGSKGVQ